MTIHPKILAAAKKVTAKRAKTVIDHLLEHGHITTQELKDTYGYNHPPRAARDVREQGIPLDTFRITGSDGRSIGAYRFGDPEKIEQHKLGGRKVFSKDFRRALYARSSGRCEVCSASYEERYLQVDHCIPYEVAGDAVADEDHPEEFLFICASCQRSKSWTCERCTNWTTTKSTATCQSCYWGSPQQYDHIAGDEHRRVDVVWTGQETADYDQLAEIARRRSTTVGNVVRELIRRALKGD